MFLGGVRLATDFTLHSCAVPLSLVGASGAEDSLSGPGGMSSARRLLSSCSLAQGETSGGQELVGNDDGCLSIKRAECPRSQAPLSPHKLLNCSANLFGHFKNWKMTLGFQLLYVKPGMSFRKNLLGREIF